MTKNYKLFMDQLKSMVDLADIEDAIKVLTDDSNSLEIKLQRAVIARTFKENLKRFQTDKKCPKCGKTLYLSDLPEYDYLCTDCQENYFEGEI